VIHKRYLLGLDIGSSSAKVALFDTAGQLVAISSHPYATAEPRPGYKEQTPEDWWGAACRGIRHVMADIPSEAPLAVAVTGHISSLTFVDADGRPLRASIGFQDQRAVAETNDLYAAFSRGDLAALLGIDLPPAPTWPLPRLLWFRKHEPATLQKARYLLQAKDFINFRLTGTFASDPSSNRGMINSSNGQPASSVFAKLDLPYLLPPLFSPQQVIGHISAHASRETGLRCGVPVVAGWNDLNACVLGSGAVKAGQAFNVTGTSEHIGVVTTGLTAANELICAPYLPGTRLLYGVTSSGGGSLQWFSHLSGQTIESLLDCPKSTSEELLFLPYLDGERSPIWDPHASGVFFGLRATHRQGDLSRAVLEGVAFSLRQNLEIVERHCPFTIEEIAVSGGASRSRLWNQIKANVMSKRIAVPRNPQAGVLGAAILASVAAGVYPTLESATGSMTQVAEYFDPHEDASRRLDRLYVIYKKLYPALRDIFPELRGETDSNSGETRAMGQKHAVVFSAGKIARGFIGHLLTLSGYHITFIEKNPALVDALRRNRKYTVHILGAPDKNITIRDFDVFQSDETQRVVDAVANASVIFVSIGGPNLPQIAPLLAEGLQRRTGGVNIILGENYFEPAQWLRKLILEHLDPEKRNWFTQEVGIVETMILRSTIEPSDEMKTQDPLSLKAQDMWELPADKKAFVGEIPNILGLLPKDNFQAGLIRKLFTYNSINAVIAYTGHLKGYELLSDAANDPELIELARASYQETSEALCRRYGLDQDEQREFAEAAIAKYRKREIVDPIERNTRDPLRKLSRNDRLVGPACLALEFRVQPIALSRGIAAALLYDSPADPSSVTLQDLIRTKGVREAVTQVCGLENASELANLICSSYDELAETVAKNVTRLGPSARLR
jgi:sugar (pentulose or hexulose) kinase/mannitol-1-phosphate/altronate dehydrogenase